jgi:DNA-binding transcriptional regulator YdaS (Cro superfamily)
MAYIKVASRAVLEIVAHFGTQKRLADELGINRSQISLWIRTGVIPALRAMQIEKITDGKFKALDINTVMTKRLKAFDKELEIKEAKDLKRNEFLASLETGDDQ